MADSKQRFIPLDSQFQYNAHQVLYYDSMAPLEQIYDNITGHIHTVMNLAYNLQDCKDCPPETLSASMAAVYLILNETYSLLNELNPKALRDKHFGNQKKG